MKFKLLLYCLFLNYISIAQPNKVFTVIHCDPDFAYLFSRLEQMVDSADAHSVPLTIELSPAWVDTILGNPIKLNKVRQWQIDGHEIAAHHHGIYHCFWDLHTNYPQDSINANQGLGGGMGAGCNQILTPINNMQPFWDNLDDVAGDSLMLTWGSSDDYPAVDLKPYTPYRTDGGRDTVTQGFSDPYTMIHGPTSVGGNSYGEFMTCQIDHYFIDTITDIGEMISEYNVSSKSVMGAVTHVFDFDENVTMGGPNYFYAWLNFVDTKDCRTVRNILRSEPVCGDAGIQEFNSSTKELIGVFDVMGRATEYKPNTLLIYIYSDGTTEKVFSVE